MAYRNLSTPKLPIVLMQRPAVDVSKATLVDQSAHLSLLGAKNTVETGQKSSTIQTTACRYQFRVNLTPCR